MGLFDRAEKLKNLPQESKTGVTAVTGVTRPESLEKSEVTDGRPGVTSGNRPVIITKSDFEAMIKAGRTEFNIANLDAALFLFALNLVRSCPDEEFMDMGHRFCPYWRKRLDPEAWLLVKDVIKIRLEKLEGGERSPPAASPH